MSSPSVLHLVGEGTGCSLWRVWQPCAALQKDGYPSEWSWHTDAKLYRLVPYFDVVNLCRLSWMPGDVESRDTFHRALKRAGRIITFECDDDMFSDDYVRRLVNTHGKDPDQAERIRQSYLDQLALVDGITTSTQRLATVIRAHTDKPVVVVPNAIDLDWWRSVQTRGERVARGLTIGWAGGVRSDNDFRAMAEAWGRIARRFPKVTFLVVGHWPKLLTDHVPLERLRSIQWLPLEHYPLAYLNIDIGCCPLADTPFNRCKSNIKALEYAASGTPVVASPTVYGGLIRHKVDGLIAHDANEWEAALTLLVESKRHRVKYATRLFDKVARHHSLNETVWRWPAAWQEIVDAYREKESRRLVVVGASGGMKWN